MNGLIVDNFAGGGGASLGIELAMGRPVDIAINHDAQAIAMHAANHPHTRHLTEDVFEVSPRRVCAGRPVELAWFSPDCKHFSKAKGARPVDKRIRGLAWVAVKWASQVRPRVIMLENVEEFKTWGPLGADGKPDPARRGETFRQFLARLQQLGYTVEHRELVAADYGAPTTRKRLFLVARCDGQPITWPEPTHSQLGAFLLYARWRTAAEVLDWDLPTRSLDGLCARTRSRIRTEAPLHNGEPYIMAYYGNGGTSSLTYPLPTVVGRDRFALIIPGRPDAPFRMLQPRELARAQGFPDTYHLTGTKASQVARIGNSVCPQVAAALVRANLASTQEEDDRATA